MADLAEEAMAVAASRVHTYRQRQRQRNRDHQILPSSHSDTEFSLDQHPTTSAQTGSSCSIFSLGLENEAADGRNAILELIKQICAKQGKWSSSWPSFERTLKWLVEQKKKIGDEEQGFGEAEETESRDEMTEEEINVNKNGSKTETEDLPKSTAVEWSCEMTWGNNSKQ